MTFHGRLWGTVVGMTALTVATSAAAQGSPPTKVTYKQALALAREQAPKLHAARAVARETEARVQAASVWSQNPRIMASAGPRWQAGPDAVDWSISARQQFPLGGQRRKRVAAAKVGVRAGDARLRDAERLLLREVSLAFVAALYWQQRVRLAEENLVIARSVRRVATQRHAVGDAGGLEKSVATLAVMHVQSDEARARAALLQATGRLSGLLGADSVVAEGDLRSFGRTEDDVPVSTADLTERPDLQALEEDASHARAEAEVGRAQRAPDLILGASYAREESADIVQGTLGIRLPLFDHGQGTTAMAKAREERVRSERRANIVTASADVRAAEQAVATLQGAARDFEEHGLAALRRAEDLATATYEAGAMQLSELLAVRRELVQAKVDYAALLLGAATAHVELVASRGDLQ